MAENKGVRRSVRFSKVNKDAIAARYSLAMAVTIRTAKSNKATAPTKARKFLMASKREVLWAEPGRGARGAE